MSDYAIYITKSIDTTRLTKSDCKFLSGYFMGVLEEIQRSERKVISQKRPPNPNITMINCNSK